MTPEERVVHMLTLNAIVKQIDTYSNTGDDARNVNKALGATMACVSILAQILKAEMESR